MKRNTIWVIPAWYPTKDNTLNGSFFKEQVELLSNAYDMVVLRIERKYVSIFQYILKKLTCSCIYVEIVDDKEKIKEYYAEYYVSFFFNLIRRCLSGRLFRQMLMCGKDFDISDIFEKEQEKCINRICEQIHGRPTLVYGITAQGAACSTQVVANYFGVPYVFGEHNPFPVPGELIRERDRKAIENANLFLAISNDKIRQVLMQRIVPKKIEYVGNPVDNSLFRYSPIKHEYKTFIIVAAYNYIKNYDLLIEAFGKLVELTTIRFNLIIAGYDAVSGYTENGRELENKIKISKFSDKVEMIRRVEREQLAEIYNRSDAFVMTSIQEGQPCAAMEAACCGLPIFATRCGGIEDYVNERMGRIVEITDSNGLAIELKKFLEGETQFDNEYISNTVIEKFGKENYLKRIERIFADLIKNG